MGKEKVVKTALIFYETNFVFLWGLKKIPYHLKVSPHVYCAVIFYETNFVLFYFIQNSCLLQPLKTATFLFFQQKALFPYFLLFFILYLPTIFKIG